LVADETRRSQLEKLQKAWDFTAQNWAEIFLYLSLGLPYACCCCALIRSCWHRPAEDEKWTKASNLFGEEDKVFDGAADIKKQIAAAVAY